MVRLALALALVATPALAAEPTFTRADIDTAYAMGRADALRDSIYGTPAAKSLTDKMGPAAPPPATPSKP